MGVSKILDKRYYKKNNKDETIECTRKDKECIFCDINGKCIAEWCIFDKLPKVIIPTKKINCIFCDNTKKVSTLSTMTEYVCPECRSKIKELMRNERSK